ncbi:MAG: two-component regulator propeller domain-containing protein, partial [Proteiniphilum sp.]
MKTKIKILVLIHFTLCFSVNSLMSQPEAYFKHYGFEDGLPQHTITDILQDEKGFMWFSTWDGLSKFDGYTFTTYHLPSGNITASKSSRIDNLYEDKYNNIWALSYDNQAFRFNVETASFLGTNAIEACKGSTFAANQIVPLESGKVWLLSEKDGCIVIIDSLFNAEIYNTGNQNLTDNYVHAIHEDRERNSWILTNRGLTMVPADGSEPVFYFHPLSTGRFKENAFTQLFTGITSDIKSIREISSEKILILSSHSGFVIFNTYDGRMEYYNSATMPEIKSDRFITSYIDHLKNVWLETDQLGVSKFNPYTGKYIHFTPFIESTESNVFLPNFFIFEDKEDRLWVHPRGGGFSLYDKTNDRLIPFYNDPSSSSWMFSNM